jgi:hypothetical protein
MAKNHIFYQLKNIKRKEFLGNNQDNKLNINKMDKNIKNIIKKSNHFII